MPIDTSILTRGMNRVEMESPSNALARMLKVQGAQQEQEMNALKMDEYKRGVEDQNFLRSALSAPGADPYKVLLQRGKVKEAGDYRSSQLETDKKSFDLNKERFGVVRRAAASFANDPTISRDKVLSALQAYSVGGVVPEHLASSFAQELPEDPVQLKAMLLNFAKQDLSSEQLFTLFAPKATQIDSGQQISFRDTNPNSPTYGQNTGGAPIQRQMTPGEVASNQVARGNLAVSQSRLAFDQGNAVSDAGGPSQAGLTKRYGKAPPGYRWKDDGTAEAIPGGPADIKAGEAGAKAQGRKDAAALAAGNVLSAVTDAKNLVGLNTTGPGSILSKIPGSDARDLQAKLDTVKANLGFDRLQQMREMSPTGGALGAVAVQELIALQSTVASLDQAQSAKELKKSLEKIEGHYNKWLQTVNGDGGAPAAPAGGGFKIISVE